MPRAKGDLENERLARELSSLARLDWREHDRFRFERLPILAEVLGLSGGREDAKTLRMTLSKLALDARAGEIDDPPPHNRSLADAWTALLTLDEEWVGKLLIERRHWLCGQWRTNRDQPIASVESLKTNFEPRIYKELAARLLDAYGEPTLGTRRRSTPKTMPPVPPAPWPVQRHSPAPGQEIVILIAAHAMRHGPASGLMKLVREFEPYWRATKAVIYSLEGSYREIWRAGLLHNYEHFVALPAGSYGGLVHATDLVVAAAEARPKYACHVVFLIDPRDHRSLYPATASMKRECLLTRTAFLTTHHGAARWFRLEWARRVAEAREPNASDLLLRRPQHGFRSGGGLEDVPGTLALAAHDRHKRAMMDFADQHVDLIEQRYAERWATRVTGHLLNGGSIFDTEYETDTLRDVRFERREGLMDHIEDKTFAWETEDRETGPGSTGWIRQLTRGRQGGVVQLARKVLNNECDTVLFFQDAERRGEEDLDIQVLDRAAQLTDSNCLLLYDEESAGRWADNVALCRDPSRDTSATTLTEAYRRIFGVELVLAYRDTAKTADAIWNQVTITAATYVMGVLVAAASRRGEHDEPIRFGFPWGGAISDVLGDLPGAGDRLALVGALGLHEFVDARSAIDLHNARGYAVSEDRWLPLPAQLQPFRPEELKVVPTVGVIGARDRALESHALVRHAVKILGGEAVTYPESAFALTRGGADPLGNAPKDDWERLDLLLLSAAPLLKRPGTEETALATALPADLAAFYGGCEAAVGTIYLEKKGKDVRQRDHDAYIQVGISVEQIRGLRAQGAEVVLVNGAQPSRQRRRAAWAALKAGIISTFITDEAFAWGILRDEMPSLKVPGTGR